MKLEELHPQIVRWLEKMEIKNYTIHENGVVDVNGTVQLAARDLDKIPVQFGYVTGNFLCSYNDLKSLKGCPHEVDGTFSCSHNHLTTLEGGPRTVGEQYVCSYNALTSLKGAPREVGGLFNCSYNHLTSLQGAPREIGGDLFYGGNEFKSKPNTSFIHIGGSLKKR